MLSKLTFSFILLFTLVISVISYKNYEGLSTNYDWDLNNRVAPPNPTKHDSKYYITPKRLKEIRKNLFYWFYDEDENGGHGDLIEIIGAAVPQVQKDFNFKLSFLGSKYNYTKVSKNGYLEFTDQPEHYTYPLEFPTKKWPEEKDPSFIGIFFSKCRIGRIYPNDADQRTPGVYFRLESNLKRRKDRMGVEVRERTKYDIREGISNARSFTPDHVIIVTWKNMSFSGGIDNSLYKTNSFQMVLAIDKKRTYAIFNYASINWTTHPEAGGDLSTGEGGVPAFVGYNAGNGSGAYEYKPYSQELNIRDLTSKGLINGKPGRHIFRIDQKIKSNESSNKGFATSYGNFNIKTFDGSRYRSIGTGEFVLVKGYVSNDKIDVQGRFEQLGKREEDKHLTSIATRGNLSTVIEVRLRPPQAQLRYKMDVLANGQLIYPSHHDWKYPHFDGVTISTPNHIFNQSEITISYSAGVNIEVKETGQMLTANVYTPYKYVNKTRGLFGNWSLDPSGEFVLPDGRMVYPNINNLENIYRDFIVKWKLTDIEIPGVGKSLFNRTIELN